MCKSCIYLEGKIVAQCLVWHVIYLFEKNVLFLCDFPEMNSIFKIWNSLLTNYQQLQSVMRIKYGIKLRTWWCMQLLKEYHCESDIPLYLVLKLKYKMSNQISCDTVFTRHRIYRIETCRIQVLSSNQLNVK